METLKLKTVAELAGGIWRQGNLESSVSGVSTDSRAVNAGDLFVALRGDKFDGHAYAGQTAREGAAGAMVARDWATFDVPADFALLEVEDTLLGYQQMAAGYRRRLPLKVVAITGSNGKTSTKDLTAAVLAPHLRVLKTEGNFNNHIGVPRTLLRASAHDQVAVVEMGMNHPGEIAPLARMAAPDIAIITNIGSAHLEYMGSRAAIAEEKGTLAEAVGPDGTVVLNADDEFTRSIAKRTSARVVTAGLESGDVRALHVRQDLSGSRFRIFANGQEADASLPVPGEHMIVNALLAVAAGMALGLSLADCLQGLAGASLTEGRLEIKSLKGLTIIDDSYNANPDSMVAALATLARMPAEGRRIAVLGKMGELGEAATEGHERVGAAAARERIDYIIAIGKEAEAIAASAGNDGANAAAAGNIEDAARMIADFAKSGDVILIKGSRSAAVERILPLLSEILS